MFLRLRAKWASFTTETKTMIVIGVIGVVIVAAIL
jgi:hypothetical protein